MKRLALPVAMSVVGHVVVAVWVRWAAKTEAEAETEAETVAETETETETVDVELLAPDVGDPALPFALSPSTSLRTSEVEGPQRMSTAARITEHPLADRPARAAPPRILSAHELARLLPVEPERARDPLAPPEPRRPPANRSEMVPDGGGARRVEDSVFTARIGTDGKVRFEDQPNLQARFALPGKREIGEHLERWAKDPYGTATADERAIETGTVTIIKGSFDLTDWAMRHAGMDPYQHRKLALMDRTREERAGMAVTANAENLRDSVRSLPRRLRAIWRAQRWSIEVRRRLLFELWDECAEDGSDEVVAAADQARAMIVAFIRRELAEGGAVGYPAAELAALDARRQSRQRFAPYATGASPPR